ncbi:MAG: hypothetical protein CBD51_003120 [Flavobacteriales bacterium TMED191]|nr:MAG: hypothetical protein CBD51_003120 [Flavobacteriales bacterium TMED191]|tara:strand:+ start:3471 stop:3872 length:402 start_codon:yes stop_codon:yes gene_type:complete
MKNWKPFYIENSRIPVFLSKFAPIKIWAISFGLWVWCRGELSEKTKRHECIHFQQQLELAFAGQWILYIFSFIFNYLKTRDATLSYYDNVFEREAYGNEADKDYLSRRKRYAWIKYINKEYDFKERVKRSRLK